MVPHYAQIANVIQSSMYALGDVKPWEEKTFRPGRIIYSGVSAIHC